MGLREQMKFMFLTWRTSLIDLLFERLQHCSLFKQSKALVPPPDPSEAFDDDYDSNAEEPLGLSKLICKLECLTLDVFPNYDPTVVCGSARVGNDGEESDDADEDVFLMLFKCTRRDARFLPPPKPLHKLKEALAKEGFEAEPCWFTVHL